MPRFLIEEEGRPTRAYKLLTDAIIIGRIDTADLVLPDQDVSRKHALVERAEGAWLLSDNGSANGTVVNGATVEQHRLVDGDKLILGKFTLTFRADDVGDQPEYGGGDTEDGGDDMTHPGGMEAPPAAGAEPGPAPVVPTVEDAEGVAHPLGEGLVLGTDLPAVGVLPFVSPGAFAPEAGGCAAKRGSFLIPMYVNGRSVVHLRLKNGDEVRVGSSRYVYRGP
jgi:hypothetical protein